MSGVRSEFNSQCSECINLLKVLLANIPGDKPRRGSSRVEVDASPQTAALVLARRRSDTYLIACKFGAGKGPSSLGRVEE